MNEAIETLEGKLAVLRKALAEGVERLEAFNQGHKTRLDFVQDTQVRIAQLIIAIDKLKKQP